ncbi:hypothetical protein H0H93_015296 [Arthromyces matolae]|nr:hypothetical protein H0H93_015296 [Arthromyces matolae]
MASFRFYIFIVATIMAFFTTLSLAAPSSELQKRDYTGVATWFEAGLGTCGKVNADTDLIVAIPTALYASGSHCGKKVQITDVASGVTVTATVEDSCPTCGAGDLDMTPSLFSRFESTDVGVFQIKWKFL